MTSGTVSKRHENCGGCPRCCADDAVPCRKNPCRTGRQASSTLLTWCKRLLNANYPSDRVSRILSLTSCVPCAPSMPERFSSRNSWCDILACCSSASSLVRRRAVAHSQATFFPLCLATLPATGQAATLLPTCPSTGPMLEPRSLSMSTACHLQPTSTPAIFVLL